MNFTGLGMGLFMLFAIGFGFFWVIKVEYYLGARVWKGVLVVGLLLCLTSLFTPGFLASALLGIIGGSVVWGATELPGQEERVRRGLFPANPNRRQNLPGASHSPDWLAGYTSFALPLQTLQWAGSVLAAVTFTTIGIGHMLVRRLHARFGTQPAVPFFALGGLILVASLFTGDDLLSAVLGITAITLAWDGVEMYRQEKRMKQRDRG